MVANVVSKKLKHANNENSLYGILGIEEDVDALSYTDVPAFEQKTKPPFQTVIVHFRNAEDLKKFSELVEQPNLNLDGKRSNKSTWYPALKEGERGQNSLVVWCDENDPDMQELLKGAE
jgi:hypothetical protein